MLLGLRESWRGSLLPLLDQLHDMLWLTGSILSNADALAFPSWISLLLSFHQLTWFWASKA